MAIRDRIAQAGIKAANALDSFAKGTSGSGRVSASVGSGVQRRDNSGSKYNLPDFPSEDTKSLNWDPFALVEQVGFKEKPTAVTYGTLATMVWKVPVVQAVIQTRVNQLSAFCTPSPDSKFDPGFRIRLRDGSKSPSKAALKYARELEAMFMYSGVIRDPRDTMHRDGLELFMRKIARDSLTYDQMCFEVVPGRNGLPAYWTAVDAASVRLADTSRLTSYIAAPDEDTVTRVQIYDNSVIAEFTASEMAFAIRNPRSDIRSQGYGTSELEMLISTITSMLWAFQYNQNAFSQGSLQKGILNIVGNIPEKQLRAFRRHWFSQVSGVENAWRTPITNAEKLEWINLQASNKDMEFSDWMDFLIKIVCAIYQMDPIEVNFKYGSGSQKSMFDSGNKSKLTESKDRGLRPLLRFIAREFDKMIVHPLDPDFSFEFVGLDAMTPKEMADLDTQRVRTIYTIDEMRAERDKPPLPDGAGEIILDSNWIANKREIEQRKLEELQAAKQAVGAAQQTVDPSQPPPALEDAPATPGAGPSPGQAAQQVVPEKSGGPAPGANPAAGIDPKKDEGPTEDQIAKLEGLLNPSRTDRVDKSLDLDLEL